MGIQGLTKLLADYAPSCMKQQNFKNYFGRKVAVDASMHMYQFLIVVGRTGDQLLTNEAGDVTSHITGMFNRTVKMLEAGLKPVYVFDGKPPELKKQQLDQRRERNAEAHEALKQAQEAGDNPEAVEKYSKRTVKVTKQHNDDCKKLLELMGVPVIDAPSEAEAQCAALCKAGVVYGVATEDMDSLTFGTPTLIRYLMSNQKDQEPLEFDRSKALEELKLTDDQFIDLCILCGCDYCPSIRGIGPHRALQLITKHGSLEAVLKSLDPAKYAIPEHFPYEESREVFKNPEVLTADSMPPLKWSAPDEDGLIKFLVEENNFSEQRVRSAVAKIVAAKSKSSQGRLEAFFGPSKTKQSDLAVKRKAEAAAEAANKKGKTGKGGKAAGPVKKGKLGGFGKK